MRPGLVEHILHPAVELLAERGPQMAVRIQRRRDAGMAQPGLDLLRVSALGNEQCGARMPEIMVVPTSAQARLCRPPRYADLSANALVREAKGLMLSA